MAPEPRDDSWSEGGGVERTRRKWMVTLALSGALALAVVAVFAKTMRSYDHNEGLYMTAGWLMAHGRMLYGDFSFWQMPYSAALYATVFWLFEPSHVLLTGKLLVFVWWLAALALYAAIAWSASHRVNFTVALTLLFAVNPTVIRCAVEASNYVQPVACALAAFLMVVRAGHSGAQARWCWLGAGVCTALAVGFKLYYLTVAVAFLAVALGFPRDLVLGARLRGAAVPYVAGMACGLAPVALWVLRDPAAFWFNNLQVHNLTTEWWRDLAVRYRAAGRAFEIPIAGGEKLRFAAGVIAQVGNGAIIGALAIGAGGAGRTLLARREGVLAAALIAVGVVTVFVPTPMWAQYWGLPVPFLLVGLAVVLPRASRWRGGCGNAILALALLMAIAADGRRLLREARQVMQTENWAGIALHREARELATRVPAGHAPERLATMQQVWAAESGRFEIIAELAYAPFTFVIADRLAAERRACYRVVGPVDLAALLRGREPTAVHTGHYDFLFWREAEEALEGWSDGKGFHRVEPRASGRLRLRGEHPR